MDDELLMTVHNNDGYGIDMQRIERIRALLAEVERLQLVTDMAEEELVFQRDINQQIGKENEQLKAEVERLQAELEMRGEAWGNSVDVWLDERKRLTEQNAAMREVVEAVAAADPVSAVAREWSGTPGWLSVAIDRVWVTKARAILAAESK